MKILYNLFIILFSIWYLPYFLFKNKQHAGFLQKLGVLPREVTCLERPIWIHAVSVGEAVLAAKLAESLKKQFPARPIIVSTTTKTGNDMIRKLASGTVSAVFYYPIDAGIIVSCVVRLINPGLYIMIETELWPNLLAEFKHKNIPVVLVNGRISDKSFSGYNRIRFFTKRILSYIDCFCMQTEESSARIKALGALPEKVFVTGSMKFDEKMFINQSNPFTRQYLGFRDKDEIIIAGSTHSPEERTIIDIYASMPRFKLIMAPRHIDRINEIKKHIEKKGLSCRLFSDILNGNKPDTCDILLVDTIGHLKDLYSAADIVFIGGSLAKKGGQNPIEAARFGKAVLFGPYMFNFREIAESFLNNNAAVCVKDAEDMENTLRELLKNPEKRAQLGENAKNVINKNIGALEKTVARIKL